MASEYLKKKYKDVKPDKPIELTEEEKRRNWWYYNKWYIIGGAVAVLLVISFVWDVTGRGEAKPDFQVAYVGSGVLPDDTAAAIEESFAGLAADLNGDGQVLVQMRQYVSSSNGDPSSTAAVGVRLMMDIIECESFIFLLEDPAEFQQSYHALCRLDGTLPEDDDNSVEGSVLLWSQCPALTNLELGDYDYDLFGGNLTGSNQDLLAPLYIARRGFWTEEDVENRAEYTALWENLTAGAVA